MRKGERKLSLIPYFLELEARENRGLFERLVGRFICVTPENHSMDEMVKDSLSPKTIIPRLDHKGLLDRLRGTCTSLLRILFQNKEPK